MIGWREWVGLPELGVSAVKAKVDTGARSSALHVFDLQLFTRRGRRWARFKVHPLQRNRRSEVKAEAPVVDERKVRNSGGAVEKRLVIVADIILGGSRWPIELTLTNRDAMGFRMLLGRAAVRGRFLVHPGRSYIAGKRGKRQPIRTVR